MDISILLPDIDPNNSTRTSTQDNSSTRATAPLNPTASQHKSTNYANRRRRNRLHLHELPDQPKEHHNFIKYFIATAKSGENLSEIDVITANRDLERNLNGPPKRLTELRNGSLLIEVTSEEQSIKLQETKSLGGTDITVEPHRTLNQCKGTIHYLNKPNYTDEQLLEYLAPYKVTAIYRIMSKRDNTVRATPIYTLTFNSCKLPETIRIGWTQCSVRLYVPKPRRCFKCQRFGHGSKTCRSEEDICANCGESHDSPCTNTAKCVNCEESHQASSKNCFYYKFEADVLQLQATDRISYHEAKRITKQKLPHTGPSYASVATRSIQRTQNRNERQLYIAPTPRKNLAAEHDAGTHTAMATPPAPQHTEKTAPTKSTPQSIEWAKNKSNQPSKPSSSRSKPNATPTKSNQGRPARYDPKNTPSSKRQAEESPERPSSSQRKGKSLLTDFPMPPNMPTSYPPPMSNNIPIVGHGRYEPSTKQQIPDNNNNNDPRNHNVS